MIDQGQAPIGGYTNDDANLVRGAGPWIVFGDHTRALKYIDFPFCMGADGVKVLKAKAERLDSKFLFHFLSANEVPSAGYSRHFKFLRRLEIPLPSLDEQRRITAILDSADALRRKRQRALELLDGLTQSIFLEMFGDLSRGFSSKERLLSIADLKIGFAFKSSDYSSNDGDIYLCRGANVLPGKVDWSDLARWPKSRAKEFEEFNLSQGDIVIAMDRPWISSGFKAARIGPDDVPSLLVQRVARLRPKKEFDGIFIYTLIQSDLFKAYLKPTETTVPHISPLEIRNFSFDLPARGARIQFAARVGALMSAYQASVHSVAKCQSLFSSLQHRAFTGQL